MRRLRDKELEKNTSYALGGLSEKGFQVPPCPRRTPQKWRKGDLS